MRFLLVIAALLAGCTARIETEKKVCTNTGILLMCNGYGRGLDIEARLTSGERAMLHVGEDTFLFVAVPDNSRWSGWLRALERR